MDKRDFARSIKEYLGLNDFKVVGVNGGAVSLVRENEEIQISYRKYPGMQYCLSQMALIETGCLFDYNIQQVA